MTEVPEEIYIGLTEGLWPIEAWISENHAAYWAGKQGQDRGRRRVFLVRLTDVRELEYVPPAQPRLVLKGKHR